MKGFEERPKTVPEIKRLITKRKRQIREMEKAMTVRHPAHIRRQMVEHLHGLKMNLQSWQIYLADHDKRSAA